MINRTKIRKPGFQDAIDFRTYEGATPTNNTGPSQDHTSGSGNYLYLESSACYNKYSVLKSPCVNVKNANQELTFWYHMLGGQMGDLHLDIYFGGQWILDVTPPIIGDQGNQWRHR